MISLLGSGQLAYTGGQTTNTSNSDQKADQSLALQTNIKGETAQHLSNAVSPIVSIENSQNDQHSKVTEKTVLATKEAEKPDKTNPREPGKTEEETSGDELTEEEEKQVQDLKKRDAEVKVHEQAHAAVGGSYASAPSYEYTTGPDNKQYAVGGEVKIDASPVPNNPEATIRKMDIVIRAALAPAEPSSQDKQVALQAQKARLAAQQELSKQTADEQNGKEETSLSATDTQTKASETTSDLLQTILAYKANQ